MGTSCSSIKKKNRQNQNSSLDDEEPFDDQRRCSNRSVESLPYGTKSLISNTFATFSKAGLIETSQESSSPDPIISSQPNKNDNHMASLLKTSSPLPSSRSPSPFTNFPSSSKQFTLTPGLPNLDQYSNFVGSLLTGQKLAHFPQFPLAKEFCIYLITNSPDTYYLSINKIIPDLKKLFSQKDYEINLYRFNPESFKYLEDNCLKDICLESLKSLKSQARLIPLIILEDVSSPKLLPKKINKDDFNVIISSSISEDCKNLFKKWYILDENNLKPTFILQSISTHLLSFKSKSIEHKIKALDQWNRESDQMLSELEKNVKSDSFVDMYLTSLFDEELKFLNNEELDLGKQVLFAHQNQLDKVASTTKKLISKLGESISSNHKLILPSNESNITNEKTLCEFLMSNLKKIFEVCLEEDIQADLIKYCSQIGSDLYFELVHQTINRFEITQNFVGRESILNSIQAYLSSSLNTPMIITGSKGIGKSSLLAQVSFKSMNWFPSSLIIYRSIGISNQSFTCEKVFQSICEQCCLLYGVHVSSASHIILNGKEILQKILTKVTEERPLIIIIDGLDQTTDYSLLSLDDCLFQHLAPFVKLILSTNYGPVLEKLQKIWEPDCFLNLENISFEESFNILENILKQSNRTISFNQKNYLKNHLTNSDLTPFLISLIGHEACKWSSSYTMFSSFNFSNFEEYILSTFQNFSNLIGSNLFIAILTLISCTKYGISDQEILDIINQDPSLFAHHSISKFEFSFWTYIKLKLLPFVKFEVIKGLLLIQFNNKQIKNLVNKFVQSKVNQFEICLSLLLKYFQLNEKEKNSLKLKQDPLNNQWPNRRKAQELIYLLIQYSTESIDFFNNYLLDLKWICFKLSKCDGYQMLEDIQLFLNSNCSKNNSEKDLKILKNFIQLVKSSIYPLQCDGLSIISQVFFRLKILVNEDSTLLSSKFKTLLNQVSRPFLPSLLPLNPLILPQKENWNENLEEKSLQKTNYDINMFFTIKNDENHVISLSTNRGEICVYNIYKPDPVRRLTGINQPKDLRMIDKFRAVVLCNRDLIIYDLNQGKLESKLKGVMNQKMPFFGLHNENYLVALSRNRMYVNMQSLKTGDLETTFKVGEDRFLNSLLVSANGTMCVCGDETQKPFPLLVWDLSNRKLIYDLRIPHHEFITRLSAISDDGHYVVSVCKELNTSSPNFIIVYDLQSGTLFKKWKPNSNTISIAISSQSSCVVNCVETALLLVWDLSTGAKRLTLYGHSSPVDKLQFSENGQIVLSYDSTKKDRSLRLWNINSGACVAVFTPDQPLSSCQLSINGKVVVMSLTNSLNFHTLILCHNTSIEDELKAVTNNIYGDKDKEGQVFDLLKES